MACPALIVAGQGNRYIPVPKADSTEYADLYRDPPPAMRFRPFSIPVILSFTSTRFRDT
jgi:hypothetical protein